MGIGTLVGAPVGIALIGEWVLVLWLGHLWVLLLLVSGLAECVMRDQEILAIVITIDSGYFKTNCDLDQSKVLRIMFFCL